MMQVGSRLMAKKKWLDRQNTKKLCEFLKPHGKYCNNCNAKKCASSRQTQSYIFSRTAIFIRQTHKRNHIRFRTNF